MPGPIAAYTASARVVSMRSIDPFTMPSSARSASSAWVSTSTSALPMATTSVAGPAFTCCASLRHGLPGAERDGDAGGCAGRGRPGREAVVVDRPEPAADGGGAAVERGALHERTAERLDDRDRKSTRLNSSHPSRSYAGFCMKKTRTPRYTKDPRPAS